MIRFEGRNPRAEEWVRKRSSDLITEIVEDQRQAVRDVVQEGIASGRGARDTALEIVGRINRATGKREGGILGLTSQQAGYVTGARQQLASGDAAQMRAYLGRRLRDKRYDGIVRRALEAGKPVAKADIDRITGRYSDRLLNWRGEVIARTESIGALHAAQYEGMRQLIDTGKVNADQVTKSWQATGDARTRDSHAAMHGESVRFDRAFTLPSGALMRYPSDTALGAPASEVINCRCFMQVRVDYLRND